MLYNSFLHIIHIIHIITNDGFAMLLGLGNYIKKNTLVNLLLLILLWTLTCPQITTTATPQPHGNAKESSSSSSSSSSSASTNSRDFDNEENKSTRPTIPARSRIRQAKLGRIAVHETYRGQGLGRQVGQRLQALAQESCHDSETIRCSLTPHHYLHDFYARLGYTMVPNSDPIVVNSHVTLLHMEKWLSGHDEKQGKNQGTLPILPTKRCVGFSFGK